MTQEVKSTDLREGHPLFFLTREYKIAKAKVKKVDWLNAINNQNIPLTVRVELSNEQLVFIGEKEKICSMKTYATSEVSLLEALVNRYPKNKVFQTMLSDFRKTEKYYQKG